MVEHHRQPEDGHLSTDGRLERRREAPRGRRGRLEQRHRTGLADRPRRAGVDERPGAAVEDGLAGADGHDEIGLDECRVDAVDASGRGQRAKALRLAVVHDDLAAEVSCAVAAQEQLQLAAPRAAAEAAGDEHGDALARHAVPGELVEDGGEGVAARVVLDRGERHRRRLDDHGRASAARRDGLERRAGERVAERLDDGRLDIGERIERRRRREQRGAVRDRDEREPRARVEGDAEHAGHLHERAARGRDGRVRRWRGTGDRRSAGTRAGATCATT